MHVENPTPSNGGASITERLESFLAAEDAPEPANQPDPKQEAQAEPEVAEEAVVEPEGDAQQEDGPQLTTADLAKVLGIDESLLDVDEDGQAIIKTKIDGQEGAAKLQDFLKSYQLKGHVDNESRAVAEQKRALQSEREQFQQAAAQQAQQAVQIVQLAQAELMQEAQGINWDEMARNDPAGYVEKQHQFQQRQARLNQLQTAAQQQAAQYQQHLFAEQTEKASKYLAEHLSGWAPGNDLDKQMNTYAASLGMSDGLGNAIRQFPQIGVLLQKASEYDRLQQSKSAVEAKVRAAPKIVKPGQPQAVSRQEQSVRNIKTQIRNSGGKQGVVEYLLATGKV